MILTKGVTEALNEGYEISFYANRDVGPNVLEINMRKDGFRYKQFMDIAKINDPETIEQYIDHVIRYATHYEFHRVLKGEK